MRIIAGSLGGQTFEAPKGHRTHPMSDKVRGGLFGVLGDISGLSVLDAFAGSGALSLEATSRGAASAVAIDIDKNAVETAKKNIQKLGVASQIKVTRANASGWSKNNPEAVFDLILCDPPFDDLQLTRLQALTNHLQPSGIFVINWPGKLEVPEFSGLEIAQQKNYGDAQLVFYCRFEVK